MASEIRGSALAATWLHVEDGYQWQRVRPDGKVGKFEIGEDVRSLWEPSSLPWDVMFHNRWGRIAFFHEKSAHTQAAQNVGKLASGARAFVVAATLAQIGEPYERFFEAVNDESLGSLLDLARRPVLTDDIDWTNPEITSNSLGQQLEAIGLPFDSPQSVSLEKAEQINSLYITTFDLMAGYFERLHDTEHPLPEPGHTSGIIVPWQIED